MRLKAMQKINVLLSLFQNYLVSKFDNKNTDNNILCPFLHTTGYLPQIATKMIDVTIAEY